MHFDDRPSTFSRATCELKAYTVRGWSLGLGTGRYNSDNSKSWRGEAGGGGKKSTGSGYWLWLGPFLGRLG